MYPLLDAGDALSATDGLITRLRMIGDQAGRHNILAANTSMRGVSGVSGQPLQRLCDSRPAPSLVATTARLR